MNTLRRILTLITAILIFSLACLQTTIHEEDGSAAPSTAPSADGRVLPTPHTTEEEPAGAVYEMPTPGRELCAIVIADEALHLRAEPNADAQVIEWLIAGEQVKIIEPGAEWSHVRTLSGLEGYAKAEYLRECKCDTIPTRPADW